MAFIAFYSLAAFLIKLNIPDTDEVKLWLTRKGSDTISTAHSDKVETQPQF
jgi:hypothetical protein